MSVNMGKLMFHKIKSCDKHVSGLWIICSNILNNFELFKINVLKYLFKYVGEYDKYMGDVAKSRITYIIRVHMCIGVINSARGLTNDLRSEMMLKLTYWSSVYNLNDESMVIPGRRRSIAKKTGWHYLASLSPFFPFLFVLKLFSPSSPLTSHWHMVCSSFFPFSGVFL